MGLSQSSRRWSVPNSIVLWGSLELSAGKKLLAGLSKETDQQQLNTIAQSMFSSRILKQKIQNLKSLFRKQ
jgi:hypothetical protein